MGVTREKLTEDAENLTLQTEESIIDTIEEILELYVLCVSDMEKTIRSFVAEYSKSVSLNNKVKSKDILAYSETKRRLTNTERKVFNTQLKDWYATAKEYGMDKTYQEYLQALGKRTYITRMEYLQAYLRHDIEMLFYKVENKLFDKFSDIYTYSYYMSNYNFLQTMGIRGVVLELSENDIQNAINGRYANTSFKLSLAGNKAKLINEIQNNISQGFARGFNVNKLNDIVNIKTANSRNRNIALTRTETNYLCNKANLDQYKEFGVEKYQYLATLDMRTSDMCRDMDGYIGNVSQAEPGVNFPPLHVNCYDKDTKVYTNNGWKLFKDVLSTDMIWALDPDTRIPEFVPIKNQIQYYYTGKMLKFSHKSFDLTVTPNHKMAIEYCGKDGCGKIRLVEAQKLPKWNNRYYRGCNWIGETPETIRLGDYNVSIELYCKFMGWYLSEGNYTTRNEKYHGYAIKISQHTHLSELLDDLKDFPVDLHISKSKDRNDSSVYFYDKSIYEYVQQFGKCNTKYVPDEIKRLSPKYIEIFLRAYCLGDGCVTKNKDWDGYKCRDTIQFSTASTRLRDDIGELIMKCGGRPTFKLYETNKAGESCFNGKYIQNYDTWSIRWNTTIFSSVENLPPKEVDYDDFVYCVELPKYHILLVQREGQIVWCGNCRSTTIPYIENLGDYKDRVAKTAKGKTFSVSRRLTQEQYIKKYVPKQYQDKLLKFRNSYRPKISR